MPYQPPVSMAKELSAWNDGRGVDLEALAAYEDSYRLSVFYTALLWPQFKIVGPYILRGHATLEQAKAWENSFSKDYQSVEAMMNHVHVTDYFGHCDESLSADVIVFLMQQLQEIHEAKLLWQFPDRPCRVVCTIPEDPEELDNYQITFWQEKWESTVA